MSLLNMVKACRAVVLAWMISTVLTVFGSSENVPQTDLIVYGGTAAGIMTAYSAAREGLHVTLLVPENGLGGMVTGGLSATDLGDFRIIGGYAREFYSKAAEHYGIPDLNLPSNWLSEPHVSLAIFEEMLKGSGVQVVLHQRLKEKDGVRLQNHQIQSIETEDGKMWVAKIFADCTYEGDLMAQSHVTYTYGRESESDFGESLAGVRANTPAQQFTWPIPAYTRGHQILPEVNPGPLATPGSGDRKVQAYNFRVILTNDPSNRLPFPKPLNYDKAQFALLRVYLQEFASHRGRQPTLRDVTGPVNIPNRKADFNNNGPFSTDYIGHSWTYPNGSYKDRSRIWEDHLEYTKSFFYFLANDPDVPSQLRAETRDWGLPKDDFKKTDHWPNQLYIREGRRMIGSYVMRQSDLQVDRTKVDTIGMGSYNSDSHNVQRVAQLDGSVANEGDVQVPVRPYEIPYRVITPMKREVTNLLVPVCFSASHIAYSSMRMEPQYMIMGQAAGVAAALAIHKSVDVQDILVQDLQRILSEHNAILYLTQKAL